MTDYSALTDRELDKLVAERRGYEAFPYFDENYQQTRWNLRDRSRTGNYAALTKEAAWEFAPSYSTNANVALVLVGELSCTLTRTRIAGGENERVSPDAWEWVARIGHSEVEGRAAYPSRAIVLAWLAWQGMTNEQA